MRRRSASRPPSNAQLRPTRITVRLGAVLLCLAAVIYAPSPKATAGTGESQQRGFDTCSAPSTSTMQTWWDSSPYYAIGIYLGGANRSCSQPNLTSSWISTVTNSTQRWGVIPIWVGPQMPNPTCQTLHTYAGGYISTNTSTAYSQGQSEASAAYNALSSLGMSTQSTPIAYDLEGNNNAQNSTCQGIANAFINGWDSVLAIPPAQASGVYGSAASDYFNSYASIANVPTFIWFAEQNSTGASAKRSNYVASTLWVGYQRHKQYDLNDGTCSGCDNDPADYSFGGISMQVDVDCSDGPIYSAGESYLNSSSICIQ